MNKRIRTAIPSFALITLLFVVAGLVPLQSITFVALGSACILLVITIYGLLKRDRYSRKELEDVHLRHELRQIEEFEEDQPGNVLCLCCREVYPSEYPCCPVCKSTRPNC